MNRQNITTLKGRFQTVATVILTVAASIITNQSQAQNITLETKIDTTTLLIGDQVTLQLQAEIDSKTTVEFPTAEKFNLDSLEIISISAIDTTQQGESRLLTANYTITGFDSGTHTVPATSVIYQSTGKPDSILTKPVALTVIEPEVDMDKGIVDIIGPYKAPVTLSEVLPWILGVILGAALIFLIVYTVLRYRKNRTIFIKPEAPLEPAHIIALRDLDSIKGSEDYSSENIKEYYTDITDILRRYIERRYSIDTMELTSSEILDSIKELPSPIESKIERHLVDILNLSDLVKFAKMKPVDEDNTLTLTNAYLFVNRTKVEEITQPEETVDKPEDGDIVIVE